MKNFPSTKTSKNFIKSIVSALKFITALFGRGKRLFTLTIALLLIVLISSDVLRSYAADYSFDVATTYEPQSLNIYPATVSSDGWNNPSYSLAHDVGEDAIFGAFTDQNSAVFVGVRESVSDAVEDSEPDSASTNSGSDDAGVTTEEVSGEIPKDEVSATELPVEESASSDSEQSTEGESVSEPATESIEEPEAPSESSTDQGSSGNETQSVTSFIFKAARGLYSFATEAFDESNTDVGVQASEEIISAVDTESVSENTEPGPADVVGDALSTEEVPPSDISETESDQTVADVPSVTPDGAGPQEDESAVETSPQTEATSSEPVLSEGGQVCTEALCTNALLYSGFTVGEELDEQKITNMQVRVSLAAIPHPDVSELGSRIKVEYLHYDYWMDGGVIEIDSELSNAMNGGYLLFGFPLYSEWDEMKRISVRLSYEGDMEHLPEVYVDSVWLEVDSMHNNAFIDPAAMPTDTPPVDGIPLRTEAPDGFTVELASTDTEFEKDETPRFEFDIEKLEAPEDAPTFIERVGQGIMSFLGFEEEVPIDPDDLVSVEVINEELEDIAEVVQEEDGTYVIEVPKVREFKPGKHVLTLEITDGDQIFYIDQEFSWGVLALNGDKTIYLPEEEAYLQMGVLDDAGHTICDAALDLTITDPQGGEVRLSTEEDTINYGNECAGDTYTTSPDYDATYTFEGGVGVYRMRLTATTVNGVHTIEDEFRVAETVPFDVSRTGPTRIFPPEAYPVRITVTANEAYTGEIIEFVPVSFQITESNKPFRTYEVGDTKQIIWNVDLDEGETITLSYWFDAPDVSPEFYLLGPLNIGSFNEAREWQIASDAPGDAIIVQAVLGTAASATSYSATFASAPTAGNTVIMVAMHRDGANAFTAPPFLSPAVLSNAAVEVDIGIWYGAADPATSTYSISKSGGNQTGIVYLMEVAGLDTASLLNATSSNDQTGATGLIAWTGLTPTTTQYGFAVAAVGVGDNDFTNPTTASWTSSSTASYTQRSWNQWATGNDGGLGIATANVRSSQRQQARLVLTTGGVEERNSVIAVFKLANQVTTVGSRGNQQDELKINSTNNNVGGLFTLIPNTGSTSVTNITITENGTTNAQTDLSNIKLRYELDSVAPYDCASATYDGTETQYGATSSAFSAADGTSSFSGSVRISTTSAMCVFTVLDVDSSAVVGDTLELEISTPNTQVTVSEGSTTPGTAVSLSNTTEFVIGYVPSIPVLADTPAFPYLYSTSTRPRLGGFVSTDADNDVIEYEFSIDDDPLFASPATTTYSTNYPFDGGWSSTTFNSGATTTYQVPSGVLTAGQTYWWRVRARDPFNRNEWTNYSRSRSVTIGSSLTVPEWHQTTDYQFSTSSTFTNSTTTGGGGVQAINLSSSVSLLNAWSIGTTKAVSAGSDRLLVVGILSEDTGANTNIDTVRYGGQLLTEIYDQQNGPAATNGLWLGYLADTGITNATNTSITVTWTGSAPVNGVIYQSAVFAGANQTAPIRSYSANALTTGTSITPTASTTVVAGDMSIYVVGSGANRTYTPSAGYTEGTDNATCTGGCSAATAYKSISASGTELPTAVLSASTNRVLITDAVIRPAAASGTIMSPEVDFDWVSGQTDWGEVSWGVTESAGNNTRLRVYYSSTTACDTIIPNGALSGNSTGFATTSIPLNISGLSTTTYNRICLQMSLSENNGTTSPILNDWTVRWDRTPVFSQSQYRWYGNSASATPTDTWPPGTSGTQLSQNEPITSNDPIDYGQAARLRMGVGVTSVAASGRTFKLQYTESDSCSLSTLSWNDVAEIGSTTALWRGYDNTGLTDGVTLSSTTLSSSTAAQSYEEENISATMPNSIAINGQGEWDWVIEHRALPNTSYCFRMVGADGSPLTTYTQYPKLVTNVSASMQSLDTPFDNERVASTSPWFYFTGIDAESDSIAYQIQIDDDADFSSAVVDTNSETNLTDFTNVNSPSDKSPFNSGDQIEYKTSSALTNGTTYWWRVRAKDPDGSSTYGEWSTPYSVTITTGTAVSTWFQTTQEQFETDTLEDTEATTSDAVALLGGSSVGTTTSSVIDFDNGTIGNSWGDFSFTYTGASTTVRFRVEYYNGSAWVLVPDADLVGNSSGFTSSPVSLNDLDTESYNQIRLRVNFLSGAPTLLDWQVMWGYRVSVATHLLLFDNEKTGTTTPAFTFTTTDPESDDLEYQFSWSTDRTFTTGTTTVNSSTSPGFSDVTAATDTNPFASGHTIRYQMQSPLTNNTTYWWRVRAKDPSGGDSYSFWSNPWSFTVDTTATTSTWFQTTEEQFETDTLFNTYASTTDSVEVSPAGVTIYNFNGITNPSATHIARDFEVDVLDPTDPPTVDEIDTLTTNGTAAGNPNLRTALFGHASDAEATNVQYTSLSSNNNTRWQITDPGVGDNAIFWASFLVSEDPADIDEITVSLEGYQNVATDKAWLGIWRPGSTTPYWQRLADSTQTADFNYTGSITTNIDQYFDGTNRVHIIFFNEDDDDSLFVDYVELEITTNTTDQGTITSAPIDFDDGSGPVWGQLLWTDSEPGLSTLTYQLEYLVSGTTWATIPNSALSGNESGFSTSPVSLTGLDTDTYNEIRIVGNLDCAITTCPQLNDWTVRWSPGFTISGTAFEYDGVSSTTAGTVAVAVNGELQSGKTGTISNGSWSIPNVTVFDDDVITVFVDGATTSDEAVAVTVYDGSPDIPGLRLQKRHLTIGSDDYETIANTHLSLYDFTHDEDIFFNVDGGNDLTMCADTGCGDASIRILPQNTYAPGTGADIVTHDVRIDGSFVPGANTVRVNGSWDNNATTTMTGSTVVFTATSSSEGIDTTGASVATFNNVTLGETSGTATWTASSSLDIDGNLAVTYGTLQRGTQAVSVAGNLTTGTGGFWSGMGTTTFDGTNPSTWTDQNTTKQNIGRVVVDGTAKSLFLGSTTTLESLLVGADDTFDVTSSGHAVSVYRDWNVLGTFLARTGTVNFIATTTGRTITAGGDAFNTVTFNGVGGAWSFAEATLTVNNDFTIGTGTVTLPTGTTTIAGSFGNATGTFAHNNGTVQFTGSGSKTVRQTGTAFTNAFYNLRFSGSGTYTLLDTLATTSNDFTITAGTVVLPSGTLSIVGSFANTAGSFTANNGTVQFIGSGLHGIDTNASFYNLVIAGSGTTTFTDTNVTVSEDVTITGGVATFPSGTFTIGGSLTNTGSILSNSGTVTLNSSDTGETISLGSSSLHNLTFNSSTGGWTITSSATTTGTTTLTSVGQFTLNPGLTLAVGSAFQHTAVGASTTWTGSTLSLESGSYSVNLKSSSLEAYGTLRVKANTHIATWNATATAYDISSTGSLYSQDHFGVDGSLYIFGAYARNSGTEHWSYATDFDGTALGGSSRQAAVSFARDASASFTGATLQILGTGSATTTIDSESTSLYELSLMNSTLQAQYYDISHLGTRGIDLMGSTTVTSLRDGRFTLNAVGGSLITLSSSTVNLNPALQIQNVAFLTDVGTSSDVSTGNGTSTFLFFDDFNDGSINTAKWTADIQLGTITETGGYLRAGGGITSGNYGHVSLGSEVGYDDFLNNSVVWRARNATDGIGELVFRGDFGTNRGYKARFDARVGANGQGFLEQPYTGWTFSAGTGCGSDSDEPLANQWYTYQVTASNTAFEMYRDNVLKRSCSDGTFTLPGEIALQNHYGSYTDYDWVAVRPFVTPAPTSTSWGAEETVRSGVYREEHVVTGTTLGAQASYVMPIVVNYGTGTDSGGVMYCNGLCNTDFSDVRFAKSDGEPVDYWREESFTASSTATFWVELENIPTSPATTSVYAYYGDVMGFNVAQTDGTPSSYWWFRNSTGTIDGESYDNDTGDPGSIRWDDSSLTIVVSGRVYTAMGTSTLGSPTCGVGTPVRVVVENGSTYDGACDGSGAYSIPGVAVVGDPTLTVFLNGAAGGERAVSVTKTPTADISDLDLIVNRVIVRHEDTSALTIEDMLAYDSADDADIPFTAATGTLTVHANTGLEVMRGKTFAPAGNVALQSAGTATEYDGSLYLRASSTFDGSGTSTYSVGGSLTQNAGARFVPASSTVYFTATTTGKGIVSSSTESIALNNLSFTGVGGGWNLAGNLSLAGTLTLATGTFTGTGDISLLNSSFIGDGTLSLGGGTTTIANTNTLGGSTAWTFSNLVLGTGSTTGTTTKVSNATTTIGGKLTIGTGHTFGTGGSLLVFTGSGNVFVENGTFNESTSTVRYSGATGANVLGTTYYNLLVNASGGTPNYTGAGIGINILGALTVGGTATTTLTFDTSDQVVNVDGTVTIHPSGTLIGSNTALFSAGGSWDGDGTFTGSGGTVLFDGSGVHTIAPGTSSFSNFTASGTGSFTFTEHATTTGTLRIVAANDFTVSSGIALAVGTAFRNDLGGADTVWSGSILHLYGGNTYEINGATTSDTYGTLSVGTNTQIRAWNSDAATYLTASGASLYSQDHANTNGDLYIFGSYVKTTGTDHWSYGTDFNGTSLSGSERQVDVRIADGSSVLYQGGGLSVLGASGATTTIQNQGSGTYSMRIGGSASTTMSYYAYTHLDANGLVFSGTPNVTNISRGDFTVGVASGTAITVGGTAINQNPARTFTNNAFGTSTGGLAFNVTATGTALSSWRFTNHNGAIDGEAYDVDPDGDPGYIVWDDSAASLNFSGRVYSDEGSTASLVCDGSSNIALRVAGLTTYTTNCAPGTGLYTFTGITYSPGDSFVIYIDGEVEKAAVVSEDPVTSIANLDLYENRVIVRHEGSDPLTIADMALWDSSDDADIPFTAVDSSPDTLTLPANTKLIVWTGKEFEPQGNVTVSGGGGGSAEDGTLELYTNAIFDATGSETHTIGGSLLMGTGATLDDETSTFTFTTTGASRTIDTNEESFYNITLNGSGSWTITNANLSVGNDFTILQGAVTLPTGTSTIGRSFINSGGSFVQNGGSMYFTSTGAATVRTGGGSFGTTTFNGTGTWTYQGTNATTTQDFRILSGTVAAATGTLTIGGDFVNNGTFTHMGGTIRMISTLASTTIFASSSDLGSVTISGSGSFVFTDPIESLTGSLTLNAGTTVLPTSTISIGGSLISQGGSFVHGTGTVLFNSSDTGEVITPGTSLFTNVSIAAPLGGYTITGSATTTGNFSLTSATAFTLQSGASLGVVGTFTNLVGGSATTWTGTTINLLSGTNYTINTKAAGGDVYNIVTLGNDTDIRLWNSSATTTLYDTQSSLYSQDNAGVDGELYIYGNYSRSTGSDYWSATTDFDGAVSALRAVTVRHAAGATSTFYGGSLEILGTGAATTTITNQGSGTYSFQILGGTLNAQQYALRNSDVFGLVLSGTTTVTSLEDGDFELAVSGGALMTISSTTLTYNASAVVSGVRFATTSAISGVNVALVGTTSAAWTFTSHRGNLDGEAFDSDGVDACGSIRWDDSTCLLTQQSAFRWRDDDGGEGVPDAEWYDQNWTKRKRITVTNADAVTYADAVVEVPVPYDADMQIDFDDLRITDVSGTTSLNFARETYTASTQATLWVEVPTLTASADTVLYVYYGNGGAAYGGIGTTTFPVFDDFEDTNITEYSGDTSLFAADTTFAYQGSYGLEAANPSGRTTDGIYRTSASATVTQGQTVRFFQYINTSGGSFDETCTMFGVQSNQNNNYAVCLEQVSGTDRVSISRGVDDNDLSGTILASTTIAYTTGWYEVEVDWGTDDSIAVSVYKDNALVATTSATDGTYTSGGMGFTFWFQNGGWDFYTARPTLGTEPTTTIGYEQVSGGANWASALNTALAGANVGEVIRPRFLIENTGLTVSDQYRLMYAAKGSSPSCEAVTSNSYTAVPVQASCGTSAICMTTSSQFANNDPTTDLLGGEGTFVPGEIIENTANTTNILSLDGNEYTEVEYAITVTSNANDPTYCLRVSDAGSAIDSYTEVAELSLTFAPNISSITFNNGSDITLIPGATTTIYATGTVTDQNGYADIIAATTTMFRSGETAACAVDANDCYRSGTSQCAFTSCSGNSCDIVCSADFYYFADPTDAGTYAGESWGAELVILDQSGLSATQTAPYVELLRLRALSADNLIDYGSLEVNSNTGSYNATTTFTNIGNDAIDVLIEGSNLTDGLTSTIPASEQIFATSTFSYAACTYCTQLSTTTTAYELDLAKPTTTAPGISDDVYWGLEVPFGVSANAHQGQNIFYATGDN